MIVAEQLGSSSLQPVQSTGLQGVSGYRNDDALAVLRSDGSLISWGPSDKGGSIPSTIDLDGPGDDQSILQITSTDGAIAALRSDGQVLSWGYVFDGAGLNEDTFGLSLGFGKTEHIYASDGAFFLLQDDGDLYSWDVNTAKHIGTNVDRVILDDRDAAILLHVDGSLSPYIANDSSHSVWDIPSVLTDSELSGFSPVLDIAYGRGRMSGRASYAALRADGSVITWGDDESGGAAELIFDDQNGNGIADPLESGVVKLVSGSGSGYSVLKDDGSVYS